MYAGTQFETETDLVMEIKARLLFHYLSTRISESLMNSLLSLKLPCFTSDLLKKKKKNHLYNLCDTS